MLIAAKTDKLTENRIFENIKPHTDALVDFIQSEIQSFEPEIRELVEYCFRHQGKKIRPLLVFYSGWTAADEPNPAIIRAAAIMEMVHQATLVHDDILDDASLRHNSATLSKKYNGHIAVLLGDALFSHALKLASEFPTVDVCRAVSQATRRVCAGEISQSLHLNNCDITIEEYYRIIDLKTAELFRVSCQLGATLSAFDPEFTKAAATFGRHIGIAYQIFDDLSDLIGTEAEIGKTLGTDLKSGKHTLPIILLMNKLSKEDCKQFKQQLEVNDLQPETIVTRLNDEHIIEEVREIFMEQINQAEQAIENWKQLEPYQHLMNISQQIKELIGRLNNDNSV